MRLYIVTMRNGRTGVRKFISVAGYSRIDAGAGARKALGEEGYDLIDDIACVG